MSLPKASNAPQREGPSVQLKELNGRPSHQPLVSQHKLPDVAVTKQCAVPPCTPGAAAHTGARGVQVAELDAHCFYQPACAGTAGGSRGLSDQAAADEGQKQRQTLRQAARVYVGEMYDRSLASSPSQALHTRDTGAAWLRCHESTPPSCPVLVAGRVNYSGPVERGQGLVEPDELVYPPLGQGLLVAQPH